jgi:hypothetical protein
VPSNPATKNLATTPWLILMIVGALLAIVFCGNVFRFYPRFIDQVYDDTSEAVVIGRMTRSAADGLTSENTYLGNNRDQKHPVVISSELYPVQKKYFENPLLVKSLGLTWDPYRSHFGLQGIFFSALDLIDPLPRTWRIGFYHFLASLMSVGALIWIADILRRRFGWAAFWGFLIPLAIEPMLTAMAPNLYWVVGSWFAPMAIAMLLADEEDPRRRWYLIAAAFAFFLLKFLCGYEFTSTVILAAAVGCLLGVKESSERPSRILKNVAWIVTAGIAGFAVAILAHAAKEGSFAVIVQKAALRVTGDSPILADELIVGKFASVKSVIWRYLEGNDITLVKNFGIPLGLFVVVAILALMDRKVIWYLGNDRRKLHILALAFLASLAAPLSWFAIAKGHSFVHPHIDMILWYVPAIPLAGALCGVSLSLIIDNRSAWAADAARSAITLAIPGVIVLAIGAIFVSDRLTQAERAWVVAMHSKGMPLFESDDLGIQFRMTDQWFTVQYDCDVAAPVESFLIRAYQGDAATDYSFRLADRLVYTRNYKCFYAQPKADRPFTRIGFGAISKGSQVWQRETLISIPDSMTLEQWTDVEWDHGILRSTGTELLLQDDSFLPLFLRKGDRLQFASSGQRTITGISTVGPFKWLAVNAPVKPADVGDVPIRIIRQ